MNKFDINVRVYFEDTDAGGIVYHANYLRYFERARSDWVRALGGNQAKLMEQSVAFVVKDLNMIYHKSAKLDELLTVSCEPITIKRVSLLFKQAVYNNNNECLVEATVKVGCINPITKSPSRIPDDLLREMRREQ
ncbi:tol-pal system-associated acyl-CoA thioesterase [Ningiella sp. W23]|uniref:tol-pal system-associated acyl-CoA thioesterase n=1 Tax=Ningiella sp. W23 TaxID=3023715 RepID=UPI00375699B4